MSCKEMTVVVKPGEHAALDAFPLRYGIRYSDKEETEIALFNCRDHKQAKEGRLKVIADFKHTGDEILTGCFILADNKPLPRIVVTVIRPKIKNEQDLSDILRFLREKDKISVDDLLEWHPLYLKGEANNFDQLIALIGKKYGWVSKEEQEALKAQLNERDDKIREVEGEYQKLKEENERFKAEKKEAALQNQVAEKDEPCLLTKVDRDIRYGKLNSLTTRLTFEDGSQKWMKVETFDKDLAVTKRAEELVGRWVETSCWNPKDDPGKWSRMGYFRNIYLAKHPPTQPE